MQDFEREYSRMKQITAADQYNACKAGKIHVSSAFLGKYSKMNWCLLLFVFANLAEIGNSKITHITLTLWSEVGVCKVKL